MKTALNAARAIAGLLAIGLSCSAAIAMSPDGANPQITLVSTDTSEAYPFATLIVDNATYHVTEGDVIKGLRVRHITPGHVALSDNEVLVATQPNLDTTPGSQVATEKIADQR